MSGNVYLNVYLHVLALDVESGLVDVVRNNRPSAGPLWDDARTALAKCPAVFVGDVSVGQDPFHDIFGDLLGRREPRTPEEYATTLAEYEKKKVRYDRDVAAGRQRVLIPEPPTKPRVMRDPTFDELLQEEIGRNYVTVTKALSRKLVTAYSVVPRGVFPAALEEFLAAHLGRQVFVVDYPAKPR